MKFLITALLCVLTSYSFASQDLGQAMQKVDQKSANSLGIKFLDFLKADFVGGSYCDSVGNTMNEDLARTEFCVKVLLAETKLVKAKSWGRGFALDLDSSDESLVTYRKRYLPKEDMGDSLCDLFVYISKDKGLSAVDAVTFDVYCD